MIDSQGLAVLLAARLLKVGNAVDTLRHPAFNDFSAFKHHIYRRYSHAPHLQLLDEKLMQVTRYVESGGREGIGRLIVAMPPRHGKSLTVSKLYPPWHLGRNPHTRAMLVSYGDSLARKNSRTARNLIMSRAYREVFPGVALAADSQSAVEWNIENTNGEGGVDALGIGGAATGKGAHLLIIDDPHKNRAEVESATIRDKVWDSYTDDLYTRLEPGGAVIVMATRWHEDDLTGRILKNSAENWHVLELPSIAGEDDPMGRVPGQPLWGERFPLETLENIRATLGPYSWAALHEQKPRPASGGILKTAWFKPFVRVLPSLTHRQVRYWDLAMSSKTQADYTVGLKMAIGQDGDFYITDIVREQVELADLPKLIKQTMLADGVGVQQGFENKGYMTRAIQQIARDPALMNYTIRGYDVDTDKLTRVLPAAARASMGVIHILHANFADVFVEELASFPNGAHDDQVDAFSGAWRMLNEFDRTPTVEVTRYA